MGYNCILLWELLLTKGNVPRSWPLLRDGLHLITGWCDILKSSRLLASIWDTPTWAPCGLSRGLSFNWLFSPIMPYSQCYSWHTPRYTCPILTSISEPVSRKSSLGLGIGSGPRNGSVMGPWEDQTWNMKALAYCCSAAVHQQWKSIRWWRKECTEGCCYLRNLRSVGETVVIRTRELGSCCWVLLMHSQKTMKVMEMKSSVLKSENNRPSLTQRFFSHCWRAGKAGFRKKACVLKSDRQLGYSTHTWKDLRLGRGTLSQHTPALWTHDSAGLVAPVEAVRPLHWRLVCPPFWKMMWTPCKRMGDDLYERSSAGNVSDIFQGKQGNPFTNTGQIVSSQICHPCESSPGLCRPFRVSEVSYQLSQLQWPCFTTCALWHPI